jgi:type III pantothenate kinase
MRLLLDAGNSRLKWGLRDGGRWQGQGVVDYADLAALPGVLPAALPTDVPVFGANVAGADVAAAIARALGGRTALPVWLSSGAQAGGVVNRYTDPAQLGVDRWAALVGAWRLHGGPCLVVSAGTATTVDLLDAAGVFQGGLILPGFELMRRALAGSTAGLGYGEGQVVAAPRNTADAIFAGCLHAQVGAVERMFVRLAGQAGALALVSGGAAHLLAEYLAIPCRVVPNLVLEGVARLTEADGAGPARP